MNPIDFSDLPTGLGMALLKNPKALEQFKALPMSEQIDIIHHTQDIHSSKEMKQYVQKIADGIF